MSALMATFSSLEDLLAKIPDVEQRLAPLVEHLKASELQLRQLIDDALAGRQHVAPPFDAAGDLEFGLMLYWLQHPNPEQHRALLSDPVLSLVMQALQRFAPPSSITDPTLASFIELAYNIGFVAADGTLYTLGKYAQLDPLWLAAVINYAINLIDPDSIYHPFPTSPCRTQIGGDKHSLNIAIVGDWGTGAYDSAYAGRGPAVAVMNAVRELKPDYVIHLGDVYYSGTDRRIPQQEEKHNLLDYWNTGTGANTSFAINSNHEMYGAAQGLIGVAMAYGTPFAHQNRTTYFGLEFGDWLLLGLDSAYFDPSTLYMKGALGNAQNTQQQDFVKSYGNLKDRKVFVMTHHNPMSYDGSQIVQNDSAGTSLWDGMNTALGKNPDVWYWGHLHLGVAYNEKSAVGQQGTRGRCVGHSAIPFGDAHGMNTANVDYYAHTNLGIGTKQVRNGFAMVTLGKDGTMTETFYEVDARGKCSDEWVKNSN